MKLLITTQAVDQDDPVLGFFHRWVEEYAKRFEKISVICLKEGRHALPSNVTVHSLGKEHGVSRFAYILNFYRSIWSMRREYDAVFVHMNQEYVLLGAKLWWLLGKRVVLWRNHKKGSVWTRLAAALVYKVCYTSPSAYVAAYRNAMQMPIGIDTGFFSPAERLPAADSILFLGRLDAVKRPDTLISALKELANSGVSFHADIYGEPTYPRSTLAGALKKDAASLIDSGMLAFHGSVPNDKTAAIYREHAIYVNLTPSGSFDKTIGEAMASGLVAVVANDALRGAIEKEYIVEPDSAASVSSALRMALGLSAARRGEIALKSRAYILKEHSLPLLAEKLERVLSE